ncbi:family 65 glycosyl hydrolase domain-containing protein [uncultured Alistipes sp.]|uniref:family 65 glycosyl hydrolase domain-containing protein n=1 Tax=uncultured Alistipes sp. TaxID=538949 RepID=UPI002604E77F|nr:family 65 glycosyl hydrolase domain-containing protein [uncultured Alistipes sp.]
MSEDYLTVDPWKIVEERFDPERVTCSESLFSLGNGEWGGRANFEERYSGPSLQGNYIGGVYYPDRTRVGWWKNGYPEYFAKVLNAAFWIGVEVEVNGEPLDLASVCVESFRRELDMREGVLRRRMTVRMRNGVRVCAAIDRFLPLEHREAGVVRYAVTLPDCDAEVRFTPYIDADVRNADANYDEKFWTHAATEPDAVCMRTLRSGFGAAWAQVCRLDGARFETVTCGERVAQTAAVRVARGGTAVLRKYAGICSTLNHPEAELVGAARRAASEAAAIGFEALAAEQSAAWARRWHGCDVVIEGDAKAQQGIRFCIFMLLQTYAGTDTRLNIGPKGFTGEKYGGVTYWDTEAYCLPFYMAAVGQEVARELLVYRYAQLDKAIKNAAKLGFGGGAALYPMVTVNGEECHNEWEITFEEIHRNGAIAYAIYNYVRYTGDREYLAACGLEVLLSLARFWAQRISWSEVRAQYVLLGVTGPNEYENNVNNNWYTSYIARWSMRYAAETAAWVREHRPADYARICAKRAFDAERETADWLRIADGLYLGEDRERGIFLQQDGYLDKVQMTVDRLDPAERPLNQKWSWDRILRSCFIKQADVLQGLYFFAEDFDRETLRRNFDFYEPRTVHESSLSPCVHAVLAARLGDMERAYALFLRTARLDLDDYNREVAEGCHVTSMAGTWLALVEGFGGMRVRDGVLTFAPALPAAWRSLAFRVRFRGRVLSVRAAHDRVEVACEGAPLTIRIGGCECILSEQSPAAIVLPLTDCER